MIINGEKYIVPDCCSPEMVEQIVSKVKTRKAVLKPEDYLGGG